MLSKCTLLPHLPRQYRTNSYASVPVCPSGVCVLTHNTRTSHNSEKAMASHPSTLAWKIPWTEEPGRLQSMGSRRVGHNWATSLSLFTVHFHALEKEMATHSSILTWRIPGMAEPGGLPSMGSHRVGHNWSDLAAAAAIITKTIEQWYYHWVVSDSCDPIDCSLPGSSVHGIIQARILGWVAISFSRGSSWPRKILGLLQWVPSNNTDNQRQRTRGDKTGFIDTSIQAWKDSKMWKRNL